MKFQITIRTAGTIQDGALSNLSVFLIEAPNWDAASVRVVALGKALGLEFGQYESEVIYASDEKNTIRSGYYHRVETALTHSDQSDT